MACVENEEHERTMEWLESKDGPIFACHNVGDEDGYCEVITPGREYLHLYTTSELLEEIQNRVKEE
jgi:hypothetical protein